MTAYILKIIAMITMAIDHTGAVFFDGQDVWRVIGRIAMPLYSLMVADACRHVSKKEGGMRRYLIFLGIVALASELFYDFALEGSSFSPDSQNQVAQFFSFALAFALCEKTRSVPLRALIWTAAIVLNNVLALGYYGAGIILPLCFCFYLDRYADKDPGWRFCAAALIMLVFISAQFAESALERYGAASIPRVVAYLLARDAVNRGVFLAVPFIALYNGEYGRPSRGFRIFYRYFYPLHLFVISVILLCGGA